MCDWLGFIRKDYDEASEAHDRSEKCDSLSAHILFCLMFCYIKTMLCDVILKRRDILTVGKV